MSSPVVLDKFMIWFFDSNIVLGAKEHAICMRLNEENVGHLRCFLGF